VFTPKAQLYGLSASHSPWADFERPGFRALMDGMAPVLDAQVERVVLCSGKIGPALDDALLARPDPRVALLRLEQLYPLPAQALRARLACFPRLSEVVWTQEEARNHGAWSALRDALEAALEPGVALRCIARPDSAPSAGCRRAAHAAEQQALLRAALRVDE
jgi:2-oxoglutarate dehydrogenase E1 component